MGAWVRVRAFWGVIVEVEDRETVLWTGCGEAGACLEAEGEVVAALD